MKLKCISKNLLSKSGIKTILYVESRSTYMKSKIEYKEEVTHQYPPQSATDLYHLIEDCSVLYHDWRNLFDILSELSYRFVTVNGTGIYRGHYYDRVTGEFKVTIQTNNSRKQVPLANIVALEPTKSIQL